MTKLKHWSIDIVIDEHDEDGRTHAKALLITDMARGARGSSVRGDGTSRRSPYDENLPELGDELAVARALTELSRRLFERAASDIERSPS